VFDVLVANALFAIAVYFVIRAPTLPVLVWSISVVVFTALALGRGDLEPVRRARGLGRMVADANAH
jgi:hypothetical protein